jgi:hypothetical protein
MTDIMSFGDVPGPRKPATAADAARAWIDHAQVAPFPRNVDYINLPAAPTKKHLETAVELWYAGEAFGQEFAVEVVKLLRERFGDYGPSAVFGGGREKHTS